MALSGTQNLLNGITFPTFSVSGVNDITNGVTAPSASVTGLSVDSLKKNVTVPSVPAASTPAPPDSSMNWLWILIIIPIGIVGAAAMSKTNSS